VDLGEPLGPDSVTWKYFGDRRGLLLGLWIGVLQNMHPQIAAGVEQHSHFHEERWQRALRSFYPVLGVVYDGPYAVQTAREVVGYHGLVKGVDAHGERYHALNQDAFYWAHATFVMVNVVVADHFGVPFTEPQKDRLCRESVRWYSLYGLPCRGLPECWADFLAYWERTCAAVLEDCRAARDVLDVASLTRPPLLWWLPDSIWRGIRVPLTGFLTWVTTGLLPKQIRSRLGLRWSGRDAFLFLLLSKLIAAAFPLVPFDLRYHPRARDGWSRARGTVAPETPLVHSPARNLPPAERRSHPGHYTQTRAKRFPRIGRTSR
jgi:uncharacterized protein (DUF2236 family)